MSEALYTEITVESGLRPDIDTYYLNLARAVSTRGTCIRRQVGCVLVDSRRRILAAGYNGSASGAPHCSEIPCPGAMLPSGTGLDLCEALHAEQSALLYCHDVYAIATCYVTVSPCVTCIKLLLNTSCFRIIFLEFYSQPEAELLWKRASREWRHLALNS